MRWVVKKWIKVVDPIKCLKIKFDQLKIWGEKGFTKRAYSDKKNHNLQLEGRNGNKASTMGENSKCSNFHTSYLNSLNVIKKRAMEKWEQSKH